MSAVEGDSAARLTGVLLLGSLLAMLAGVGIVVPSGLTLNPADPAAVLTAVHARVELHLIELALDVIGWLALLAAGLLLAARPDRPRAHLSVLAGGLLAGLLWVAATLAAASGIALSTGLRRAGVAVAVSGAAAVVLPWTTGTDGPSAAAEQLGYALHLPVMLWWGALGWRQCRCRRVRRTATMPV
ncbi:hypothetical protein ACN27J_01460 [Solwaraspora sp. WMMB762]|uniref:hypothetical protein n=1 Tax=Solwaraspora sp. WMMB762 TaxID=3404120 RepID=UPI003B9640F4